MKLRKFKKYVNREDELKDIRPITVVEFDNLGRDAARKITKKYKFYRTKLPNGIKYQRLARKGKIPREAMGWAKKHGVI
jgi:hypothetical protein